MKLTDFAALTFDCYGTLIDWETGFRNAFKPWAARSGDAADDETLLRTFSKHERELQRDQPTLLYSKLIGEAFRRAADERGTPATTDEVAAFGDSVKDWPAFPDSAEALAYLKRHYKLVITSNVDRASFAESNKKLGVEFDAIVTAEDVGSYKPEHAHFHRAFEVLGAMGVAKEKILHTAQSIFHDHIPAKALGLTSIWINRRGAEIGAETAGMPHRPIEPDWEVATMAEMVEMHKRHLAEDD